MDARVEERSRRVKQRRFLNIQPAMTLRRHQFAFHFYPSFARRQVSTRFTGSSHDGFIVLCSTQIMKGFEGSKRGKGRGWTSFDLIHSFTGEEGFQELNLMCD